MYVIIISTAGMFMLLQGIQLASTSNTFPQMVKWLNCNCPRQIIAPVAQWVKCWPADLAVLGSSPTQVKNVSTIGRGSIAHSL